MPGTWESRLGMKICLVGDAGVGKSSIIHRFVLDRFDPRYVYTLGVTCEVADMPLWLDGSSYEASLRIWDIMGEKTLRSLFLESFLDSADGIMVVCDLTRRETLDGLREWVAVIGRVAPEAEVLFLGNKADLTDETEIGEHELARFASEHGARHLLVSAKDSTDVQESFQLMAQSILEARLPLLRKVAP